MRGESSKRSDFRERILPDLGALLLFSLELTKNRRDASRLMREVLSEAYQSLDEQMPVASCELWLRRMLTGRFLENLRQDSNPLSADYDDNSDFTRSSNV